MTYMTRPWRRPVLRVLVLALAVVAAPLPALAGDPPAAQKDLTLTASVQKVVAKEALASTRTAAAREQQSGGETKTDLGSGSFFKSKAGIITLVVTAVGIGFTLYSTSNDRVAVDQIKTVK